MLEKFAEIICKQLHLSNKEMITEDTSFMHDLRADSYEIMELVMALEDEYGIRIDDEDLGSFETVGDVMDFIRSQGIDEE